MNYLAKMRINVGVIGVGGIAYAHLMAYTENPNIKEIYIADENEQALQYAQDKYPKIKKAFKDYKEMVEEAPIQLVDICTPHYLHHPMAIHSLKAGKDVICEKPIATNLKEADEMIETARKTGHRLFISMNQRFMPYHKKAKELIDGGVIGRPFMVVFNIMGNEFIRMNDPKHWKGSWDKAGGGAMIDTGYHAIYMMLHFFGKPKAVTAVAKRLVVEPENKGDDNTVAILEFDEKVLGTIAISYTVLSEAWQEKRHIYGTEGSIHMKDDVREPIILIKDDKPTVIDVGQMEYHPHILSVKLALDHFVDCLLSDKEPEVKPEEARDALEVCLAIYEASKKEKKVYLKEKVSE
jgi:predicted dehydrogenase